MRVLKLRDHPIDDLLIPVIAAEIRVSGRALDLEDTVANFKYRNVERAAAEVEHQDGLVFALFVHAVGQRGRSGLVDNAQYFKPGNLASFFCRLALGIVEIGRHSDNGLCDRVAKVGLSVALELLQDPSADFLSVVGLAVNVDFPIGTHVALDRPNRAVRVGNRLTLGNLADEHFASLGECHDRRSGACAF